MKTRENKAMRFASVLLVLTLLATSLTAGTFAKYVTGDNGSAEARVAKFGVDVSVDATNVFGEQYGDNNAIVDAGTEGITVQTDSNATEKNVVAPGTAGKMIFSIDGNPETRVALKIGFNDDTLKKIELKANTYKNGEDSVILNTNYNPVKWTLEKNNLAVDSTKYSNTTLTEIQKYFTEISKIYDPNTFKNAVAGEYTLSWTWSIDGNGHADTILGDLAANANDITKNEGTSVQEDVDYNLNEAFDFSISVEQED